MASNELYHMLVKDSFLRTPVGIRAREIADELRALCRTGGDGVRAYLRERTLAFHATSSPDDAWEDPASLSLDGQIATVVAVHDFVHDQVPIVPRLAGDEWRIAPDRRAKEPPVAEPEAGSKPDIQARRLFELDVDQVRDLTADRIERLLDCLAKIHGELMKKGFKSSSHGEVVQGNGRTPIERERLTWDWWYSDEGS